MAPKFRSIGAAHSGHLSHRESSARVSAPGEGLQTIEGPTPPHPNPLPTGEREQAEFAARSLYRLLAWLSPSFPVGAYSYSSGIEWAVEAGDITDAESLRRWLTIVIAEGGGFCDAIFLVHAHRSLADSNDRTLRGVAELAAAFVPSKERHLETTAQGAAFIEAMRAAWPCAALDRLAEAWTGPVAYPVAVGLSAAGHGIAVEPTVHAYLHAVSASLISAGMRLIPLGQSDGQRVLAALEPVVEATAQRALAASLDDVATAALRADLSGMRHETLYTRIFRS
jgi:urease accessory protein